MSSFLLKKIHQLEVENDRYKQSYLQTFRSLILTKQIVKEYQKQSWKQSNSLIDPQMKVIDMFIAETEWLHQYNQQLEKERDIQFWEKYLNKQLMQQLKENENHVIISLTQRIQELFTENSVYKEKIIKSSVDHSMIQYNYNLEIMYHYSCNLFYSNLNIKSQNSQLLALNSLLAVKLKHQDDLDIDISQRLIMTEVQKKILHLSIPNDSCEWIEDFDDFSARVVHQKKKPNCIPILDIKQAQLYQQKQILNVQDQKIQNFKNQTENLMIEKYYKNQLKKVQKNYQKILIDSQVYQKVINDQKRYIQELQSTNEVLIQSYKKQEDKIQLHTNTIKQLLSRKSPNREIKLQFNKLTWTKKEDIDSNEESNYKSPFCEPSRNLIGLGGKKRTQSCQDLTQIVPDGHFKLLKNPPPLYQSKPDDENFDLEEEEDNQDKKIELQTINDQNLKIRTYFK